MSKQLDIFTDKYSAGWQMCIAIGYFFIIIIAALVFALATKEFFNPKDANETLALFSFFLAIVTTMLSTAFTISNLFCSKKSEKAILEKLEIIVKQTKPKD